MSGLSSIRSHASAPRETSGLAAGQLGRALERVTRFRMPSDAVEQVAAHGVQVRVVRKTP